MASCDIKITRSSRARHGGPAGELRGMHCPFRSLRTMPGSPTARPYPGPGPPHACYNGCLSPRCSTDLTTTGVRPPKFLDGNTRTWTSPRSSPNLGAVQTATVSQNRWYRDPAKSVSQSLSQSLTRGHPEIYTPDLCPALRKCPYGAIMTT